MGKASHNKANKAQRLAAEAAENKQEKPAKPWWRETLELVLLAAVLALAFKFFLFDTRNIPSSSMVPTIEPGDRVIMSRLSYLGERAPERGDIVVFRAPEELNERDDLIKRVVGLPGDTVEVRAGVTYLNGEALEEPFVTYPARSNYGPYTVQEGEYFLMGDNRYVSKDSRSPDVGAIAKGEIAGKVRFIIFPFSHIGSPYQD